MDGTHARGKVLPSDGPAEDVDPFFFDAVNGFDGLDWGPWDAFIVTTHA
jgi:hypothetical protein